MSGAADLFSRLRCGTIRRSQVAIGKEELMISNTNFYFNFNLQTHSAMCILGFTVLRPFDTRQSSGVVLTQGGVTYVIWRTPSLRS